MRLLLAFTGGVGHLLPTVPLARELADRGHEVLYACQADMLHTVRRLGFAAVDTGGATLLPSAARRPLAPVDRRAEDEVVRRSFAGRVARERAGRLRAVAVAFGADVVVRDEMDLGAAVAAEALGLPHAAVVVLVAGGTLRPDLVAEPLSALRAEHGLPPDPGLLMLHRHLTLVPAPPSLRDPSDPLPGTAHHVRPAVLSEPGSRRSGRSVYVGLGTVFPQESGDLLPRVLAAVRDLGSPVLVTVGEHLDPAELGPQPGHVRVERFVPLAQVLASVDLVVSHAGSGTLVAALGHGLPSVLLPMGADQPRNADRCASLGAGLALDAATATPTDIAAAVREVFDDASYGRAARRLQAELWSLPAVGHGADLVEHLR